MIWIQYCYTVITFIKLFDWQADTCAIFFPKRLSCLWNTKYSRWLKLLNLSLLLNLQFSFMEQNFKMVTVIPCLLIHLQSQWFENLHCSVDTTKCHFFQLSYWSLEQSTTLYCQGILDITIYCIQVCDLHRLTPEWCMLNFAWNLCDFFTVIVIHHRGQGNQAF